MLISMLKLLLTNAFIKKELFLQLFVPHVHITFQLVLKEIIFQPQNVAVTLKIIHFFAHTVQD